MNPNDKVALLLENERLQAIVDKLPKCWRLNEAGELVQDVSVLPGMVLWSKSLGGPYRLEVISLADLTSDWPATVRANFSSGGQSSTYQWHVQACYNTREAAEAAQ